MFYLFLYIPSAKKKWNYRGIEIRDRKTREWIKGNDNRVIILILWLIFIIIRILSTPFSFPCYTYKLIHRLLFHLYLHSIFWLIFQLFLCTFKAYQLIHSLNLLSFCWFKGFKSYMVKQSDKIAVQPLEDHSNSFENLVRVDQNIWLIMIN